MVWPAGGSEFVTERVKMNEITVRLSDESLADLHAVMLTLREKWRASPGMADHKVTEDEAIRHALAVATSADWSVADLMPKAKGRTQ